MYIDNCLIGCEKTVLKKNPVLYYCFKDLPSTKKYSVYVLYNFCFEVKNCVDSDDNIDMLDKLESKLMRFQSDSDINDSFWIGLRKVFNKYSMSIQPFKNIINVNKLNLKHNNMISMDDLLKYCYYAGSSEGFMLMPILKKSKLSRDNKVRLKNVVSELWSGLFLINILKDMNSDLRKNKIYLPDSLFQRFRYSKEEFKKGIINDNFINLWEYVANYAVNYISSSEENLDVFSNDCVESIKLIIEKHKMILNEIRINRYNYADAKFDIVRRCKDFNENLLPT